MRNVLLAVLGVLALGACESFRADSAKGTIAQPVPEVGSPVAASCPDGFVELPESIETALGYSLCVAKYEMKVSLNDGTPVLDGRGTTNLDASLHRPVSRKEGTPWARLLYSEALAECASLGNGYSLITNQQWDLIADDIASVAENWSNGILRSGNSDDVIDVNALSDGWTYANSANLLAAGDDTNGYEGTGNSAGSAYGAGGEQNRTHTLSNGQIVWDMAGNAREIVDVDGLGGTLSYTGGAATAYVNLNSAAMTSFVSGASSSNAVALNLSIFPLDATWSHESENIGRFYISSGVRAGRLISRGGNFSASNSPGIYAGDVDGEAATTRPTSGGFRCVFRPN